MRLFTLLLLVVIAAGCSTSGSFQAGGGKGVSLAFTSSILDPRVGQKNVVATHETGATVDVYKDPVSEPAAEAATRIIPQLAAALVRIKTLLAAIDGIGGLAGVLKETPDEVLPDGSPEPGQ